MSGVPLETCWTFNERWNNKFCYKVASCWLFLLNNSTLCLTLSYLCLYSSMQHNGDDSLESYILQAQSCGKCSSLLRNMGTTNNGHHTAQNTLEHNKLGDGLTLKVFWDIPSRNFSELQTSTQNQSEACNLRSDFCRCRRGESAVWYTTAGNAHHINSIISWLNANWW